MNSLEALEQVATKDCIAGEQVGLQIVNNLIERANKYRDETKLLQEDVKSLRNEKAQLVKDIRNYAEENEKLKKALEHAEEIEQNYLIIKNDNDQLNHISNERLKHISELEKQNLNQFNLIEKLSKEKCKLKEKLDDLNEVWHKHEPMESVDINANHLQELYNFINRLLNENEKLKKAIEIIKNYYKFKLFPPAIDNIPEISISTDWEHYISQQEYELLKEVLSE